MKKFIMALSILAMGGSSFLGVLNQNTLKEEMALRDEIIKEANESQSALNQKTEELADAKEKKTVADDERNAISAKLDETNRTLRRQEAELMTSTGELEQVNIKQKEIDLAIAKLNLPNDIKTAEELRQYQTARKDALAETEAKKADYAAKGQAIIQEVAAAENQVKELQSYQIQRAKVISLNGLEATVIAVNRQWGFVMVNAGKDLGVAADSTMLVKRGQERIARLRIVTLEPNMLVADVVPESLAEGARVLPGDKVIFENTK